VKEEWRGMRNGPWFARPVDTERERGREKEITASDFPPSSTTATQNSCRIRRGEEQERQAGHRKNTLLEYV